MSSRTATDSEVFSACCESRQKRTRKPTSFYQIYRQIKSNQRWVSWREQKNIFLFRQKLGGLACRANHSFYDWYDRYWHDKCAPQFDLARAKESGQHSDYWARFVNAVARELKKTHPDKYVSTLAYATARRARIPASTRSGSRRTRAISVRGR